MKGTGSFIGLLLGMGGCAHVDTAEPTTPEEENDDASEPTAVTACETAVRHAHAFVEASMVGASEMERAVTADIVSGSIETCESEGLSEAAFACIMDAETYREFWSLGTCAGISDAPPSWLNASWPESTPMPDWADWTPEEMRVRLEGSGE